MERWARPGAEIPDRLAGELAELVEARAAELAELVAELRKIGG